MLFIYFQPAQDLSSRIPGSVPKTRPGGLFGFKTDAPFFPGVYIAPSLHLPRLGEVAGPAVGVQATQAGPSAEAGFDIPLNISLELRFPSAGAWLD